MSSCAVDERSAHASLESEPRPSRSESGGTGEPGAPGEPSGPDDTVPEYGTPDLTIPGVSIPDLSIPGSGAPGLEATQQCLDLTEAYVQLIMLSYDSDAADKAAELFDTLAAEAPSDVVGHLEFIRDAVIDASDDSVLGATTLFLDEEFNRANEAVINWLAEVCQPD